MGNSKFNFCGQYCIQGLTEVDLHIDDDDCEHDNLGIAAKFNQYDEYDNYNITYGEIDNDEYDVEENINFDEWKEYEIIFNRFNTTGIGLNAKDLLDFMHCCGIYFNKNDATEMLKKYDKD